MKKRIISLILASAMVMSLGVAMTGCNGNKGKSTSSNDTSSGPEHREIKLDNKKVTVWGAFGADYYEDFLRDNPDVELDNSISSDHSLASLSAASAAGKQPDMFFTNNATTAPLGRAVQHKLVTPLDDYLERDVDYNFDDLPSWYRMFVEYPDPDTNEKHVYGIYTDVSIACLVWNKQLFEAAGLDRDTPPKTWSEMIDFAKQTTVTDASGMATQAGFTNYHWWYQHWRLTYGTNYQDPYTGKPNINTPEMVNVLEFLRKFPAIYGGADKVAEGVSWEDGKVAMDISDVGYSQKMVNDFETGIAPLPSPDDYKGTDPAVAGYAWQWYGIPAGAKNPDGGWIFARWAVTSGVSGVMEREAAANPEKFVPVYMSHTPSRERLYDRYGAGIREDVMAMINARQGIYDKISIGRPTGGPINADWETVIDTTCGEIIDGTKTVADGLKEIQNSGETLYKEYYEDLGKPAP